MVKKALIHYSGAILTDAKLRLLNKKASFGKSMQTNFSKSANSWLRRPPNFNVIPLLNFDVTAAWNCEFLLNI